LRNPGGNQRIEINEEMLRTWYVKDGRSIEQIAKRVGCCDRTIIERLKRLGLDKEKKRG
jgi:transposase